MKKLLTLLIVFLCVNCSKPKCYTCAIKSITVHPDWSYTSTMKYIEKCDMTQREIKDFESSHDVNVYSIECTPQ